MLDNLFKKGGSSPKEKRKRNVALRQSERGSWKKNRHRPAKGAVQKNRNMHKYWGRAKREERSKKRREGKLTRKDVSLKGSKRGVKKRRRPCQNNDDWTWMGTNEHGVCFQSWLGLSGRTRETSATTTGGKETTILRT